MNRGEIEVPVSVIVVEDEVELREEIVAFLSVRGMAVRAAADGTGLWRLFGEERPDLVVLDLGLPDEDGVTIAAELRRREPALRIVVTTARDGVHDRIVGYETGADIYLVKPIHLGELLAAIRAAIRQRHGDMSAEVDAPAPWQLDLTAWQLSAPSGRSIQLTGVEAQLLDCLTEAPGTPVSREVIGTRMGKSADVSDHRYVDQTIRRLRRKIEMQLGEESPIGSAYSRGYYFMSSVERG